MEFKLTQRRNNLLHHGFLTGQKKKQTNEKVSFVTTLYRLGKEQKKKEGYNMLQHLTTQDYKTRHGLSTWTTPTQT